MLHPYQIFFPNIWLLKTVRLDDDIIISGGLETQLLQYLRDNVLDRRYLIQTPQGWRLPVIIDVIRVVGTWCTSSLPYQTDNSE